MAISELISAAITTSKNVMMQHTIFIQDLPLFFPVFLSFFINDTIL